MKKLSIFVALAAVALGFSSCTEDRGPKYKDPTQFVLNIPAMQDQYIVLQEGNTLELTCSQPDYGYSAIANYSAEMSLNADFTKSFTITPTNNHLAAMTLKQDFISMGVCDILGIETVDAFNEKFPEGPSFMPIYFRAVCELGGVEGSRIVSNVVSYNHIKPYFAVAQPGVVYIVGDVNGWPEPSEANHAKFDGWTISEKDDEIGSHIYYGVFDLPANPMFRFYTSLDGWGDDGDPKGSIGYQVADNATDFPDWTGANTYSSPCVKGKGAWQFSNFPGGTVQIVLNMSDEKNITFEIIPQ